MMHTAMLAGVFVATMVSQPHLEASVDEHESEVPILRLDKPGEAVVH